MRGAPTVAGLALEPLLERLRADGVALDLGACVVRFHSSHRGFAHAMRALYSAFPLDPDSGCAGGSVSLQVRRAPVGIVWQQLIVVGEPPAQNQLLSIQ